MRSRSLVVLSLAALAAQACASAPQPKAASAAEAYSDYLSARFAESVRDPAAASKHFSQALRAAPDDPALIQGALDAALQANQFDKAVAAAQRARAAGLAEPMAQLTLATDALAHKRPEAVLSGFEGFEGSPLEELGRDTLRAWALQMQAKTDEALVALAEIPADSAAGKLAEPQKALLLDQAGRVDAALAGYEHFEDDGFGLAAIAVRHAQLLETQGQGEKAKALYELMRARADNPLAAANEARRAHGGKPPRFDDPRDGAALGLYAAGAVLVGQAPPEFYLPYLTLACALDPTLDQARLAIADGQEQMGHAEEALQTLKRVRKQSPYYESAQVAAAWLLRRLDRADEALAAARAAGEGALARGAQADLLRSQQRWGEAEAIYSQLIANKASAEPLDWRLYFARGAVRERQGRWSDAEADLQQALKLSPNQPEVLNYLGYGWVDQGVRVPEGLALIEHAVALDPEAGHIVDSLGWAYYKLGRLDDALVTLELAVSLEPENATINDHLGDLYWRIGRRIEARFQWERALALDPTPEEKAAIPAKISQGLPAQTISPK